MWSRMSGVSEIETFKAGSIDVWVRRDSGRCGNIWGIDKTEISIKISKINSPAISFGLFKAVGSKLCKSKFFLYLWQQARKVVM